MSKPTRRRFSPEKKAAILRHYVAHPSGDVAVLAEQAANANKEGNVDQ